MLNNNLENLLEEINQHYRSCDMSKSNLSDTWKHTLEQKGNLYTLDEMLQMLSPGNKVNSWIDDCNYLIDTSAIDTENLVTRKLLDLGEPDFGAPKKDILFKNKTYSSNFIHNVLLATKIIDSIEKNGITHPKIMEIGGGTGGIQYLMRSYFGEALTYYAVDIPETLLIQEWYLRNCFPEIAIAYHGTSESNYFISSGFNFMNAYVIGEKTFPFDVAINIDSMQEMDAEAVNFYIQYIEKKIQSPGIFFCQNHYGQSSKGLTEPTEYIKSTSWDLELVEFSPQIECSTESEQLRVIYRQSSISHDLNSQRLILRFLWNAFFCNYFSNSSPIVLTVIEEANRSNNVEELENKLISILQSYNILISSKQVSNLKSGFYFSEKSFDQNYNKNFLGFSPKTPTREVLNSCILSYHHTVLNSMNELSKIENLPKSNLLDPVNRELHKKITEKYVLTEYWVAYFSSIFLSTGSKNLAIDILAKSKFNQSLSWQIRVASLFFRFQCHEEARGILDKIPSSSSVDFYADLNLLELKYKLYKDFKISTYLEIYLSQKLSSVQLLTITRLCIESNEIELSNKCISILKNEQSNSLPVFFLDAIEPFVKNSSSNSVREFIHDKLINIDFSKLTGIQKIRFLLMERNFSNIDNEELIQKTLNDFEHSYFNLAKVGRILIQSGLPDIGITCLKKSADMRPDAFLHFDFIGNCFLSGGFFDEAHFFFGRALKLKPYLRHIQAKYLYSKLPIEFRKSICEPSNLELVFQRKQDFYNGLTPRSK